MSGRLNADAPEFAFNPSASEWVPPGFAAPAPEPAAQESGTSDTAPTATEESAPEKDASTSAAEPTAKEAPTEPVEAAEGGNGAPAPAADGTAAPPTAADDEEPPAAAAGAGGGTPTASGGEDTPSGAPEDDTPVDDRSSKQVLKDDLKEELRDAGVDSREHINVVFIGHVDAGKSTLSGNMLFMTGHVDQRTIDKYTREAKTKNRESWFLAFIMDVNEEEREKGKTVEVGRAYFGTEKKRFTILDAPGHKSYVPNMIQGAAQADAAVLVISARRGEFETGFERGGQTREHALLAKTLGVRSLVVVINKMDESTVNWDQERYDECVRKLSPFLKGAGFNLKKHVQFLPVSGLTGENITERVPDSVCPWYSGPSLLEVMDNLKVPGRNPEAPLRLPILDRYSDRGVVAIGKVETGVIRENARVRVMPTRKRARVEKVWLDDGTEVPLARPGDNVHVRLRNVTENDVHKGDVVCDQNDVCPAVTRFQVQLQLQDMEGSAIFTAGYSCILNIHTAEVAVEVERLISELDLKTGEVKKERPRFVKSHGACIARLKVDKSVCMEKYAVRQQLGRFTLRNEGATIAIGKIIGLPRAEVEASGADEDAA